MDLLTGRLSGERTQTWEDVQYGKYVAGLRRVGSPGFGRRVREDKEMTAVCDSFIGSG